MKLLFGLAVMAALVEGFVPLHGSVNFRLESGESKTALSAVPIIDNWKLLKDGSIKGTVRGSRNWKDGESITTSPLRNPNAAQGESVVRTRSGSRYKLAKPAGGLSSSSSAAGVAAPAGGGTVLGAVAFAAAAISFFVNDSTGLAPIPFASRTQESNNKNMLDLKTMAKVPQEREAKNKQDTMLEASVAVEKADRLAAQMTDATKERQMAAGEHLASVRFEPKPFSLALQKERRSVQQAMPVAGLMDQPVIKDEPVEMSVDKADPVVETPPVVASVETKKSTNVVTKTKSSPMIDRNVQIGTAVALAGAAAAAVASTTSRDVLEPLSTSSESPFSNDPAPIDPPIDSSGASYLDTLMRSKSEESTLETTPIPTSYLDTLAGVKAVASTSDSVIISNVAAMSIDDDATMDTAESDDVDAPVTMMDSASPSVESVKESLPAEKEAKLGMDRLGLERAYQWQQNEMRLLKSKMEASPPVKAWISSIPPALDGTSEPSGSSALEVVDADASTEAIPGDTYSDEVSKHLVPATALYSSIDALSNNTEATVIEVPSSSLEIDSSGGAVSVESPISDSSDTSRLEASLEEMLEEETPARFGTSDVDIESKTTSQPDAALSDNTEAVATESPSSPLEVESPVSDDYSFVEGSTEAMLEEETPGRIGTSDVDIESETTSQPDAALSENTEAVAIDSPELESSVGDNFSLLEVSTEAMLEEETPARFGTSDVDVESQATSQLDAASAPIESSVCDYYSLLEVSTEALLEEETPSRFGTSDVYVESESTAELDTASLDNTEAVAIETPTSPDEIDFSGDVAPLVNDGSDTSFPEASFEEILEEETPAPFDTSNVVDESGTYSEPSSEWSKVAVSDSKPDITSISAVATSSRHHVKALRPDVPGASFSSDSAFTLETSPPTTKESAPHSAVTPLESFLTSQTESGEAPTTAISSFAMRRKQRMAERARSRQWHDGVMYASHLPDHSHMSSGRSSITGRSLNPNHVVSSPRAPLEVVDPGTSAEVTSNSYYGDDVSKPHNQATALYSAASSAELDAAPVSMTTKMERLRVELKLADEWNTEILMNGIKPGPPIHNGYQPVADPLNDLPSPMDGFETPQAGPTPKLPDPPVISSLTFPLANGAAAPMSEKLKRLKNELDLAQKFMDEL